MLRVVQEVKPTWVVGENVFGLVSLALDDVLADLEGKDYETRAFVLPACGVGAAHRRYRVAIIAHRNGDGSDAWRSQPAGPLREAGAADGGHDVAHTGSGRLRKQNIRGEQPGRTETIRTGQVVADTSITGSLPGAQTGVHLSQASGGSWDGKPERRGDVSDSEGTMRDGNGAKQRGPQSGFTDNRRRTTQSRVGISSDGLPGWLARPVDAWDCNWDTIPRVATGIPDRVNKLKALGNAVVPQQFYPIFAAIAEIERCKSLPIL